MSDYIVMATGANATIRAFGAVTTGLVEEARRRHNTSPVATAALGRMLTAGVLMGSMMKNPTDVLTLQVKCSGDIEGINVTADSSGQVKGYVNNPNVILPPKGGKLDVGGALKEGFIRVVKDMGLKEPYSGQTVLQTGEIGDDLSYYFAVSEQIPSSVGLGVLMSKDNHVMQAGGFIVQVMPFIQEDILGKLEDNVNNLLPVTTLLEQGLSAEELLEQVLEGLELSFTGTKPASFYCDCSKERIEKVIISLGKTEIRKMIDDNETVEVMCHFCNTAYHYNVDELKKILTEVV